VAGRGIFNKLVDTFNAVADDARRQMAPKDNTSNAAPAADDGTSAAESHLDSARRVATDSGRTVGSDEARRVVTDGARALDPRLLGGQPSSGDGVSHVISDSTVECRFCKTPNAVGAACAGCGATPDR
jgi:hypothetical protein